MFVIIYQIIFCKLLSMKYYFQRFKDYLLDNTWIIWMVILFFIVWFNNSFYSAIMMSGYLLVALLLGYILPIMVLILRGKLRMKDVIWKLLLLGLIVAFLYYFADNKLKLIYIFPLSIPFVISGLFALRGK